MPNSPAASDEVEPLLKSNSNEAFASSSLLSLDTTDNRQPRDTTTSTASKPHEKLDDGDQKSPARSTSLESESEEEDLSLYERKCILINHELDALGMGRYQWYLWALCGFGYLIDLMWAQAFGLVLSSMQQEFGFDNGHSGNLSTAFSTGLTVGALVWGILVDIIGRKWAFNLTVLIASAFGLCIGYPDTYAAVMVLTAFTGFGVGGNIPIDTTITLKFTPRNRRYLLPLLSVFQPLGVVICSVLAYGFIPNYSCSPNFSEGNAALPSCNNVPAGAECCRKQDNMGWRYLLYTLGCLTLVVFFLRFVIFDFQESPKFLLYRGQDAKAVKVLHHVATFNERECKLTLEALEALEREYDAAHDGRKPMLAAAQLRTTWIQKLKSEMGRFKLLFSSVQTTRLTLLIWLTYICDFWAFTVAGTFLPKILATKNGSLHLSLHHTYRSYILIYLPGTLGVLLGSLLPLLPSLSHKATMLISSLLMSISIYMLVAVNNATSNIAFSATEYFFQSMFNAVLYGWTPEAFPAPVRGTACGVASFSGRVGGIVGVLVAQGVFVGGEGGNRVLGLAGGVGLGCVVAMGLVPGGMVGRERM